MGNVATLAVVIRSTSSALGIGGSTLRLLQIAAYVVIVAWGIRAASEIFSIVLLSMLLAFAYLPFPNWLMRRFHLRRGVAISLGLGFVALLYLILAVGLFEDSFKMHQRLPIYEQSLARLYNQFTVFLSSRGIQSSALSSTSFYSSERIMSFMSFIVPKVTGLFSDRVLIGILSLIFLFEIAESEETARTPLGRKLLYYGKDVQRFIGITARTGAMVAVANLTLFLALGVDFPLVWSILYFLLQFIPSIGFLIAMVPPAAVALLTFGWQRALFVLIGMALTQMASDYILQPKLMKKSIHIGLLEIMLALMVWGFLLGLPGTILGVPLTIALKKYIQDPLIESDIVAREPAHPRTRSHDL
jgi:AI-2 transport protein TqsA